MKKKRLILCMAAIIVLLPMVGCGEAVIGSGNTVTKTYDYNNFTGIEAHQGFQVELIKSNDFNIEVTVDDNIIEYLIVEKSGDTLILRLKQNRLYSSVTLRAKITMPDAYKLDLSGGSGVDVTGFNLSHKLIIELSGGSHANGDISASDIDLQLSGGSRIEITGSANNLIAEGSGGSHFELGAFPVDGADINISGGGGATIDVNGTLNIDLSGGSRVIYTGEPKIDNINLSGGSTFRKK